MTIKKDENVLAGKKTPEEKDIKRDVAIKVNSLDIFGEVMK